MRRTKRGLAMAMAAAMTVLLSACGSKEAAPTTAPAETTAAGQETKAPETKALEGGDAKAPETDAARGGSRGGNFHGVCTYKPYCQGPGCF